MCDRVDFPFVIGFFRPRIILPFEVDRQDLPYILAHERAHLARHDHWRKPIAFLLLSVFWFQPVFWIAYHLLCRDAEFACDGRALRSLGIDKENKAGYAMALLKSCPRRSHAAKLTGPLAFGGLQIKRRVDSVLTYKRPTTVRMFAALLVCAVLAVCFLTDPEVEAHAVTDTSPAETAPIETPPEEDATSLPAEAPEGMTANQSEQEDETTIWYLSEIFQYFVEELGYDPQYILDWAIDQENRVYSDGENLTLIIDIDVATYLETGKMIKVAQ